MTPKNPDKLREQIEERAKTPAKPGHERTAEGEEVPTPERSEFFGNLKKTLGRPKKD